MTKRLAGLFICLVLPALALLGRDQNANPLFLFQQNGMDGYINKAGKIVIPPRFSFAYPFSNGLASVAIGMYSGYIDRSGNWVWKPTK